MAAGAHCQVSSSCLAPSCIIFSRRLQHFIQLTRVKRVTRHFSLKIFRPKTSRKSWDSWNRPEPVPNIDALSRQLSKEEDVFFVLTCKQISLVPKSLGLWKRTAVSMANHLETSINGALFRYPGFIQILFHQFASEKKRKKLRPSKWPGKYQRAFSVATRH